MNTRFTCVANGRPLIGLAIAAWLAAAPGALADMTLTPAGVSRGFALTTAISNVPVQGLGPIGLDFFAGGVTVSTYGGEVRQFPNTDNQAYNSGTFVGSYGQNNGTGLAHFGSTQYLAEQNAGRVVVLPSGTQVGSNIGGATGLVANNANNLLYVSTGSQVFTLNPANGATSVFGNIPADGLSLSQDGGILYAAVNNGHVMGYDTTSGSQVFDSGFIPGGIDGTAVGFGTRLGFLYVNTNGGTVVEVNLNTLEQTLIASGGSRGDFVASDPSGSGDLLLTQLDSVLRLSGIPAPSSVALLGLGGLLAARRRR